MAFFYDLIDQLIYVKMLKNAETHTTKNMIYKLQKALYSLKQLQRLWYKQLPTFLFKKLCLYQINTNHSIFIISV